MPSTVLKHNKTAKKQRGSKTKSNKKKSVKRYQKGGSSRNNYAEVSELDPTSKDSTAEVSESCNNLLNTKEPIGENKFGSINEFENIEEIGKGSFGKVSRFTKISSCTNTNPSSNTQPICDCNVESNDESNVKNYTPKCVIKEMQKTNSNNDKYNIELSEFINEINIVSKLDNKNIVNIYGWGDKYKVTGNKETIDNLYYLMPVYTDIHKLETFTLDNVEEYKKELLSAIDYIHSENIAHCDIWYQNIMFKKIDNGKYSAILIDFGKAMKFNDNEKEEGKEFCPGIKLNNHIMPIDFSINNKKYKLDYDKYQLGLTILFYYYLSKDSIWEYFKNDKEGISINIEFNNLRKRLRYFDIVNNNTVIKENYDVFQSLRGYVNSKGLTINNEKTQLFDLLKNGNATSNPLLFNIKEDAIMINSNNKGKETKPGNLAEKILRSLQLTGKHIFFFSSQKEVIKYMIIQNKNLEFDECSEEYKCYEKNNYVTANDINKYLNNNTSYTPFDNFKFNPKTLEIEYVLKKNNILKVKQHLFDVIELINKNKKQKIRETQQKNKNNKNTVKSKNECNSKSKNECNNGCKWVEGQTKKKSLLKKIFKRKNTQKGKCVVD
jgi:serine/threonine protein kinase